MLYYLSAPLGAPKNTVVTIVRGQSLAQIGTILTEAHLVRSRTLFVSFVTLFGGERRITPGDYYFPHPKNVIGTALQIARGDHNIEPIKITIPEGRTVREISMLLGQKIPNFDTAQFLALATPKEGYLFPDTFFVYPSATPEQLVAMMQKLFTQKTATLFTGMNDAEVAKTVILASLLEREARGDDERAVIAGILVKRLSLGMRLQVDATVAYANGISEQELTKADFAKDSPYNTYLYKGLPPGPIANPGIVSLTAALHPNLATPYLYYLHDSRGSIHYAKTYAEHQANIWAYLR
jgi:UPF0755 protein